MYVRTYVRMHACMYICVHMCTYVYICVHMCTYVVICVDVYRIILTTLYAITCRSNSSSLGLQGTKVNSATSRLVSPANKISFMASKKSEKHLQIPELVADQIGKPWENIGKP